MTAEQNLPRPESTLAVILGASSYPKSPQLTDLPASANSAQGFHRYLTGILSGFGLSNEKVLNLCDSDESPASQLRIIAEHLFVKGQTTRDLIIFYSGRAKFATEIPQLFLATRTTIEPWERATSIEMGEFSKMLEMNARWARKCLIFDCVFEGRVNLGLTLPVEGIRRLFSSGNIAALFSSSSGVQVPIRSEYTAFSNELFDVLRQSSSETQQTRGGLSVDDVARRVRESMLQIYGERPDLYVFGDLAEVPFFPVVTPTQVRFPTNFALDDDTASSAELSTEPAALPTLLEEDVQFTAYRPREIQPRRWYKMLLFTHLDERPEWLQANEPSPLEQVKEEAERILGPRYESYRTTTDESRLAVPRDGEITFVPKMPGIIFNPPTRSFLWKEGLCVHLETFELRAEQDSAMPGIARGRVTVFLGHLILAELAISIRIIEPRNPGTLARENSESSSVRRFRRIFASYSHRDLEIVKEMERYSLCLGDRYLRDWVDLRAGERWDERLLGMITEADIFQLFWSWNSSQSPHVEREWRHAFSLRRETFIRPTYWESPWPPPPEPLLPIQFQRLEIAWLHDRAADREIPKGEPLPARGAPMPPMSAPRRPMSAPPPTKGVPPLPMSVPPPTKGVPPPTKGVPPMIGVPPRMGAPSRTKSVPPPAMSAPSKRSSSRVWRLAVVLLVALLIFLALFLVLFLSR